MPFIVRWCDRCATALEHAGQHCRECRQEYLDELAARSRIPVGGTSCPSWYEEDRALVGEEPPRHTRQLGKYGVRYRKVKTIYSPVMPKYSGDVKPNRAGGGRRIIRKPTGD